jgi:hypothetical protein
MLADNRLDERLLATFERTADGRLERLSPNSGELIYLRRNSTVGEIHPVELDFEDALRLTGWSNTARASSDDPITIGLRWQALRPLNRSLFPEIQLVNDSGQPVATSLAPPQDGFYPTWRWRSGESVTEQRRLQLPPDLAPGVYRVMVGVSDFVAGRALAVSSGGTNRAAQIGEIVVE